MLELPEALVVARQLTDTLAGRAITQVVAGQSPHRFAFFSGDPQDYAGLLAGAVVAGAEAVAGLVEVAAGNQRLLFGDGVNLRYHAPGGPRPPRHQLLIEFTDGSAISATVQMYGQLSCYRAGTNDNRYYLAARDTPSPLSDGFDERWFAGLLARPEAPKLSLKAFLATQQRIPGLGNGVLQDILWHAQLNPRRKVGNLSDSERGRLYRAVKDVLPRMVEQGGRDTETDLFGNPGGYPTVMSKARVAEPCPACGATKVKQTYLGGSIYFCPVCQPV